jgi:trans-aconitate 2-methyltransferase
MADWNPSKYLAFSAERSRPAVDLLQQAASGDHRVIVDLGCGPGNSTELLRQRFPKAQITGVDSSPAMIDRARNSGIAAVFELADVSAWTPSADVDLVFSNSLFQWIPNHQDVLRKIFEALQPGAVLAIQMPDNLAEPSHRMMVETASQTPWRKRLELVATARPPLASATSYFELLKPLATKVDVWRTTYHHVMDGHHGIVDMLTSTGLKPFTDPLDEASRTEFLAQYRRAIAPHYPVMPDGKVLLPFPRLFIAATRADNPAGL